MIRTISSLKTQYMNKTIFIHSQIGHYDAM